MRFEDTAAVLAAAPGTALGTSGWLLVDQARVDAFAEATGDSQWIHVDRERAASGPFGTTIAHGHLTLSLLPALTGPLLDVGGLAMVVNYGFERVRFLAPVPTGSRVRATAVLAGAERTGSGVRVATSVTVELEGAPRPALVAEALALLVEA